MGGRIMNVCKVLLTNCKAKSSHTRSKLKRLRKLLPLIWLSIAMLMLSWLMLRNVLISMNKLWHRQRLRAVVHQFHCNNVRYDAKIPQDFHPLLPKSPKEACLFKLLQCNIELLTIKWIGEFHHASWLHPLL